MGGVLDATVLIREVCVIILRIVRGMFAFRWGEHENSFQHAVCFQLLQLEACLISAMLVSNSYFKLITKSKHMHDEYTLSFYREQDFTYYLL